LALRALSKATPRKADDKNLTIEISVKAVIWQYYQPQQVIRRIKRKV
jgi:hypothetical protein